MATLLKYLKKGDYFTKKDYGFGEVSETKVWVRGDYDRSTKKYECFKFDDVCKTQMISGTKEVYIDFTF